MSALSRTKPTIIAEGSGEGRRYLRDYLPSGQASELLEWLQCNAPWHQESVTLFGRTHPVPRLVAWYGDKGLDYRYANRSHPGSGWPRALVNLKERLNQDLDTELNFVLANRYRDGADCMGWHRDDEAGLNSTIASLSLGGDRRFLIRGEGDDRSTLLTLEHGSLLVFDGGLRHALPRTRRPVPERINLTFRMLT